MAEEEQRDRGILTPVDREYLLGNKQYQNNQQEINRRSSIRNRVRNSIVDFNILLEYLSENDRKQVFSEVFEKNQSSNSAQVESRSLSSIENTNLEGGIIAGLGFLYLGCKDGDGDFVKVLEQGIRNAEKNMIVSISIQEPDDLVDSAAQKLLDNESLSSEEAQAVAERLGEDSAKVEADTSTDHTTKEGFDSC